MTLPPIVLALLSIAISVAAQFALKAGMSSPAVKEAMGRPVLVLVPAMLAQPWLLAGFALYGIGAVVWLSVLARWDVSKAYPLVGMGFAMTLVLGWVLGEQVGLSRSLGVLLICAGVFLVSRS